MLMSQKYDCNSWYPKKLNDRIEKVHQAHRYTVFIKIYVMTMSPNYDFKLVVSKEIK